MTDIVESTKRDLKKGKYNVFTGIGGWQGTPTILVKDPDGDFEYTYKFVRMDMK